MKKLRLQIGLALRPAAPIDHRVWCQDERGKLRGRTRPCQSGNVVSRWPHGDHDLEFVANRDELAKVSCASGAVLGPELSLVSEVIGRSVPSHADAWVYLGLLQRVLLPKGCWVAVEIRVEHARLIRAARLGRTWIAKHKQGERPRGGAFRIRRRHRAPSLLRDSASEVDQGVRHEPEATYEVRRLG